MVTHNGSSQISNLVFCPGSVHFIHIFVYKPEVEPDGNPGTHTITEPILLRNPYYPGTRLTKS